jgi:phosphoenolpyruvate carboxykinase (ATP)
MPLAPHEYAEMLGERMKEHGATVWLVNTGWTGGPFGEGHRMEIKYTRAMVNAALDGELDVHSFEQEKFFGLSIPTEVPGVPADVLNPKNTWKDKEAYDSSAESLGRKFHENFTTFASEVDKAVLEAGPLVGR